MFDSGGLLLEVAVGEREAVAADVDGVIVLLSSLLTGLGLA